MLNEDAFATPARRPWDEPTVGRAHAGRVKEIDTPEQIEKCLSCRRSHCVNCLSPWNRREERRRAASDKRGRE